MVLEWNFKNSDIYNHGDDSDDDYIRVYYVILAYT